MFDQGVEKTPVYTSTVKNSRMQNDPNTNFGAVFEMSRRAY